MFRTTHSTAVGQGRVRYLPPKLLSQWWSRWESLSLKPLLQGSLPLWQPSRCLDSALGPPPLAEQCTGQACVPAQMLPTRQSDLQDDPPFFESLSSHPPKKGLQMWGVSTFSLLLSAFYFATVHGHFLLLYIKLTSLIYSLCLDLRAFVSGSPWAGSPPKPLRLISSNLGFSG